MGSLWFFAVKPRVSRSLLYMRFFYIFISTLHVSYFLSLNNFHSLKVVDRVSEIQLQVGKNSDRIVWRLKGYKQLVSSSPIVGRYRVLNLGRKDR